MKKANLCDTCWKRTDCFSKGIFKRDECNDYDPMSLDDLTERDKFINEIMVGPCPKCGSANTSDCESSLELTINDPTLGNCLDCGIYWCSECGCIIEGATTGIICEHWGICEECHIENDYVSIGEFLDRICPSCENYHDGCQLEDPSECKKEHELCCPFRGAIYECSRIKDFVTSGLSPKAKLMMQQRFEEMIEQFERDPESLSYDAKSDLMDEILKRVVDDETSDNDRTKYMELGDRLMKGITGRTGKSCD